MAHLLDHQWNHVKKIRIQLVALWTTADRAAVVGVEASATV
jgi:hypothetical protein